MRTIISAAVFAAATLSAAGAGAVPVASSDPILFWNDRTVALVGGSPLAQTRTYAIVNIAMHDAVSTALGRPSQRYLSGVGVSAGGDVRAAASKAAHGVLVALNPANAALYNQALEDSLALIPDGPSKTKGVATGAAYAAAALANRAADGSAAVIPYLSTGAPGDYRVTAAPPATAAAPHWGRVTPFVMSAGNQFRPGPPPALDSAEYAAAYNEVKAIGAADSLTRLPDQTASALFWEGASGAPWLRIGLTVAEDEGLSTLENAQAFARLATSLADALIGGFDAKYHYRLWRPISAIREGGIDGNDATTADAAWASLFRAPVHPSYVSTHSALSGAGATVLAAIFGDDEGFSLNLAGNMRMFTGLEQAAIDGANSRLWGGIHFSFDNEAGLALGRAIGARSLSGGVFAAVPAPGLAMLFGLGVVGLAVRRR